MFRRTLYLTILIAFGSITQPQVCWAKEYQQTVAQDFSIESEAVRVAVSEYADENPHVVAELDRFLESLLSIYQSGDGFIHRDISRIFEATQFAAKKHQGQLRINEVGAPYIIHPIGVARYLLQIGQVRDPDVIIAALLHDTVEDTDTTFEEIESLFGSRVCGFVAEVTDDKDLPKAERKRLQIERAPSKTAGAAEIKLADKLYNLTDLFNDPITGWPKERIDAYFVWAWDVVDNLPWVDAKLKSAVKLIHDRYWQRESEATL